MSTKKGFDTESLKCNIHFVHCQMYAEALHENERLKSRLQDSKQELGKIRSQLEKVTQVQKTERWKLMKPLSFSHGCAERMSWLIT